VTGALVAAALLAGCGSDSSSNASATDAASAPLSKKQFVKQASEICEEGVKKKDAAVSVALKEFAAQSQAAPTPQDTAEMVEKNVTPSYRDTVDQLSQLGVPKGDEAEVRKMIGEFETALQAVEAEPVKATKENPFTGADKAAEAYGIETCRL